MSLPHDHLSPLLLKAERAIKNSHFNCHLSFIICFGLFYLLQHSSHVHTDSMWLSPCETVGSMEMVVSQGLLDWCVLCVQHNDWYIVGIQKVLAGTFWGTKVWTIAPPEKFIGWTVQCLILLDNSVLSAETRKWSVIFYSCFHKGLNVTTSVILIPDSIT